MFRADPEPYVFEHFSVSHWAVLALLAAGLLFLYRNKGSIVSRKCEVAVGISLLLMEAAYQAFLLSTGQWSVRHSLPIELSSITVQLTALLLIFRWKWLFQFMFLFAVGGAAQAMVTPVLSYDFPHFRFIHFFYTHMLAVLVMFYFRWGEGWPVYFRHIGVSWLGLNLMVPFIWIINTRTGGNYWFIMRPPSGRSILDFFGPQPWHFIGMQAAALFFFFLLWILVGSRRKT
ncbi:TIGR02206 family membrane protein [Alkalicoccus chagannorensis]|uniref:YwaF family protein n=1 Tax=Alkalicoccus chagannorensis TaxID=427072 RepID=UPI000417853D|nr:TIGR02206 family membrane protein [Alkalicoccus chagannorensis]